MTGRGRPAPSLSCNAPVPGRVARLAADLRPALAAFSSVRERHSLLLKRLGEPGPGGVDRTAARLRRALAGAGPARVRVTGIDAFLEAPVGPAPVVYLAVEGGVGTLHDRLVAEFGAVEGLEGPDYVPHVTLARGGDPAVARRLAERDPDPVEWTLDELHLYDAASDEVARRISLPV